MVKVAVPTGAQPGQQIQFTMPSGVRVMTTVQEPVMPGDTLTVAVPTSGSGGQQQAVAPVTYAQFQPASSTVRTLQPVAVQLPQNQQLQAPQQLAPLLPMAEVSLEEVDRQASNRDWLIYGLAFPACCFCGPFVAMIIWAVLATIYFCKPAEERLRRPRQYGPACAAASTIGVLCCCMCLIGLLFIAVVAACSSSSSSTDGSADMQSCLKSWNVTWDDGYHHHEHHHHHPPPYFLAKNVEHRASGLDDFFEPPKEYPGVAASEAHYDEKDLKHFQGASQQSFGRLKYASQKFFDRLKKNFEGRDVVA